MHRTLGQFDHVALKGLKDGSRKHLVVEDLRGGGLQPALGGGAQPRGARPAVGVLPPVVAWPQVAAAAVAAMRRGERHVAPQPGQAAHGRRRPALPRHELACTAHVVAVLCCAHESGIANCSGCLLLITESHSCLPRSTKGSLPVIAGVLVWKA